MLNYGGGWTYGVDPYPTGDQLFGDGLGLERQQLLRPEDRPAGRADHPLPGTLSAYEDYLAQQVPVLWMPQPVYQISEISSKLHGVLPQSPIEGLTPEDWSVTG